MLIIYSIKRKYIFLLDNSYKGVNVCKSDSSFFNIFWYHTQNIESDKFSCHILGL